MVKIIKLQRTVEVEPDSASPYDLRPFVFGSYTIMGRPFEFDSEPVDEAHANETGDPISGTKFVSTCPECGAYLELTLETVRIECECGLALSSVVDTGSGDDALLAALSQPTENKLVDNIVDPFRNPFIVGLVSLPSQPNVDLGNTESVADRIDLDSILSDQQ